MSRLQDAFEIAKKYQHGFTRKDGVTPYICHNMDLLLTGLAYGVHDEECQCLFMTHDIFEELEDHGKADLIPQAEKEIKNKLGFWFYAMTWELTKSPGQDKDQYMLKFARTKEIPLLVVKSIDRICNVRSFYLEQKETGYYKTYSNKANGLYERAAQILSQECIYSKLQQDLMRLRNDDFLVLGE